MRPFVWQNTEDLDTFIVVVDKGTPTRDRYAVKKADGVQETKSGRTTASNTLQTFEEQEDARSFATRWT